jgi:hypothetical protein
MTPPCTLTALASQLALTLALTTRTPSVQVVDSYTYREVDQLAGLACRALQHRRPIPSLYHIPESPLTSLCHYHSVPGPSSTAETSLTLTLLVTTPLFYVLSKPRIQP